MIRAVFLDPRIAPPALEPGFDIQFASAGVVDYRIPRCNRTPLLRLPRGFQSWSSTRAPPAPQMRDTGPRVALLTFETSMVAYRLAFLNHRVPTACDTPVSTAASSLALPAAIAAQNRRRSSRPATGGRPVRPMVRALPDPNAAYISSSQLLYLKVLRQPCVQAAHHDRCDARDGTVRSPGAPPDAAHHRQQTAHHAEPAWAKPRRRTA